MIGKVLGLLVGWWWLLLLPLLGGCQDMAQQQNVMQFLQEAKAEGKMQLSTNGGLKAGMRQEFFAGADGTAVSFNGSIDFADRKRHVTQPEPR